MPVARCIAKRKIVMPAAHDRPLTAGGYHVLVLRSDVDRGQQASHSVRAADSNHDAIATLPGQGRNVIDVQCNVVSGAPTTHLPPVEVERVLRIAGDLDPREISTFREIEVA